MLHYSRLTTHFFPKITDFGLAKHLDAAGDGPTQSGQVLGTPSYMAPEQARGRNQEIGPATDVYALGAILYELLTGRPPFKGTTTVETLDQVWRDEPAPPTRIQPRVPCDLETICLKCLAKHPARRYASAAAVADDIQRFLSGEPITARPASGIVRTVKWVRRRPTLAALVAVSVLASVALVAGAVVDSLRVRGQRDVAAKNADEARTAWQQANEQRDSALKNLRRARTAVDRMLTRVGESELANLPYLDDTRRKLLEDALDLYREFLDESSDDPEVRQETGLAFARVGEIYRQLGRRDQAEQALTHAIDLQTRLRDEFPDEPRHARDLGVSLGRLGQIHELAAHRGPAEQAYHSAFQIFDRLVHDHPGVDEYERERAAALSNLGPLYRDTRRPDQSAAAHRQAIAIYERLAVEHPDEADYDNSAAANYNSLGLVLQDLGQVEEAERVFRKAMELRDRLIEQHPSVMAYRRSHGQVWNNLAVLYRATGRMDLAEPAFEQALATHEQVASKHPDVPQYQQTLAQGHRNLGNLYFETGRRELAATQYEKATALHEQVARAYPDVATFQEAFGDSCSHLGNFYNTVGRPADAQRVFLTGLAVFEKLCADHRDMRQYQYSLALCHSNLAVVLRVQGQADQSRAYVEQAAAIWREMAEQPPETADFAIKLAGNCRNMANLVQPSPSPEAPLEWLDRALKLLDTVPSDDFRYAAARSQRTLVLKRRASWLSRLGRHTEALSDLDTAIALDDGQAGRALRLDRSTTLARMGRHQEAVTQAAALRLHDEPAPPEACYDFACCYALASAAAGRDTSLDPAERDRLAAAHATRAVELLRQAGDAGFFQNKSWIANMKQDADLVSLRGRTDFVEFVRELEQTKP